MYATSHQQIVSSHSYYSIVSPNREHQFRNEDVLLYEQTQSLPMFHRRSESGVLLGSIAIFSFVIATTQYYIPFSCDCQVRFY